MRTSTYGIACALAVALVAAYIVWHRRGHDPAIQLPCPIGQHLITNSNLQGCVP